MNPIKASQGEYYIPEIQRAVHALAREKGWWPEVADGGLRTPAGGRFGVDQILAKIALIHSEVSEAVECVRKGETGTYYEQQGARGIVDLGKKPVGLPSELADIIIRTMDLAEVLWIDLERAILEKHEFNKTRPHRHGGKLA